MSHKKEITSVKIGQFMMTFYKLIFLYLFYKEYT